MVLLKKSKERLLVKIYLYNYWSWITCVSMLLLESIQEGYLCKVLILELLKTVYLCCLSFRISARI